MGAGGSGVVGSLVGRLRVESSQGLGAWLRAHGSALPRLLSPRNAPWELRRRARLEAAVLAVTDALAPALEAGLPQWSALAEAARAAPDPQVRRDFAAIAERGRSGVPLGEGLAELRRSSHADSVGLDTLSRAWLLGERLGTPLAATARVVADVSRAELASSRALAAAVTEARATVRLLVILPLLGPVLAWAVGIAPEQLFSSPAAAVSGLVGMTLLCLGRWWMSRLVAGVASADGRPSGRRRHGGSP